MKSFAAAALLLVPLVLAACTDEGTGPLQEQREPESIAISASDIELDDGDTLQVFANVLDQRQNVFSDLPEGVELQWRSDDPSIVAVDGSGRLVGVSPGTTQVRAETADGLSASASVTVRAVPQSILVVAGGGQDGLPNSALPDSVTLRVVDRHDDGVPGAEVRFRVVSGGGSISPTYATTDAAGEVRVSWTLGPVIGDQQMQAFAGGAVAPLAIDATISQVIFGALDVATTATAGGTLAGAIRIDSNLYPAAVGAAHVVLTWDPAKLQLQPASLTSGDYARAVRWFDNGTGELHVVSSDPDMLRGDFAIAGLAFDVVGGAGTTTSLQLAIEQLVGIDFLDVSAAGVAGDVQVTID
ncbi:MAG TPA: hypothetical protein VMN78_10635 [Longimicrobiales bacterium]|nr:hypothetical protein [Longimicrobiales bacterium]